MSLCLHAAHPLGIGAPIIGDRLYGRSTARLALHAEYLTQRRIDLVRPAPF